LVTLALTVTMLLPALTSIAEGSQIRANPTVEPSPTSTSLPIQAEPTPTNTPRVDDITAEPTVTPTETPINEIVAEPSDPTVEPTKEAEQNPHTIQVANYTCPDDVPPDSDWFTLAVSCTAPLVDVDFLLDVEGVETPGTTDENGQLEWLDVQIGPTGEIGIDQDTPDGYGEPIVWCVSFPEAAADPEDFDNFTVPSLNGSIVATPELHEPFIFSCTFFNYAGTIAAAGDNSLTINKFSCPLGAPYEDFGADIGEMCTDAQPGIPFSLSYDDTSDPRDTDAAGQIVWIGLPATSFEVWEDMPDGYEDQIVYCRWLEAPEGLGLSGDLFNVPAALGTFAGEFPADGMHLECNVFNLPRDASSVVIDKRICPPGVEFPEADAVGFMIDDLIDGCADSGNGFEFTLDNAHGESTKATEDGVAYWVNVPHGPFTVTETIPLGYGEPGIYCHSNVFDEAGDVIVSHDWYKVDAAAGVISGDIDAEHGEIFHCWVFNTPGESTNTLVVNKWLCPPDFDEAVDDPWTTCTEPLDGVTFTLDDLEETTGEVIPGSAFFVDVPPGDYELTEVLPDGTASSFIGECTFNGVVLGIIVEQTEPPTIPMSFAEGDYHECDWFNIPEYSHDILIYKAECPEGTVYDAEDDWYFDNCNVPLSDIEFSVTWDTGGQVAATVDGVVAFDDIPPGTVGIQEDVPAEYGEPVVICSVSGFGAVRIDAPTGYFEHEFPDDFEAFLTCWIFNIPGDPGDVTVYKWTCPPGYDLYAEGADPKSDCVEATNGIQFQFGAAGLENEAVLQSTGDNIEGGVFFETDAPGTYRIVEIVPDGVEQVFVLECTGHIMGQLQPYPLQTGNVLEIDIASGEHLVCHWFNVPETEGGDLVVVKYACTTEVYESEVDCEVYEGGQDFDLLLLDTGEWAIVDSATTDGVGRITWTGLEPGTYHVAEADREPCHIEASVPEEDDGGYALEGGEELLIEVYNCGYEPGADIPTKYPNTGTAPTWRNDSLATP
jgi:hypothetical protein